MDPSRAGPDPDSGRLGRIRPCLGRLAGAFDLFSVDLGVHPTRVGPIRPDQIIKHPFGFQCFLKTGPTQDGSNPDLIDLGVQTARMDPIRPDEIMLFENGPDPRRIQPRFHPTWMGPTVPGSTCGCFRPVLGRFRDASNLILVDSEVKMYPGWT